MPAKKSLRSFTDLKRVFDDRLKKSEKHFQNSHPHAVSFLSCKNISLLHIREHATKLFASGIVAGSLMLATPTISQLTTVPETYKHAHLSHFERETLFARELTAYLSSDSYTLTSDQEEEISKLIKEYWNIHAYPVLESRRLNTSYGLMGAEQHMPRFPGDTLYQHDELKIAGISPSRGAWGYFVRSKDLSTNDVVLMEKYYVAVQTLYLPDWNTNWVKLKEWYKFRKVVVINPKNGRTIVADIADAGPAKWTGKHFGGSPELMEYLDLYKGPMKGEVLLFFVDDPHGTVNLGPVTYN